MQAAQQKPKGAATGTGTGTGAGAKTGAEAGHCGSDRGTGRRQQNVAK